MQFISFYACCEMADCYNVQVINKYQDKVSNLLLKLYDNSLQNGRKLHETTRHCKNVYSWLVLAV